MMTIVRGADHAAFGSALGYDVTAPPDLNRE